MLDDYLNSLDEVEKEKTASQARFGAASVGELAKLAGVVLGEHICMNCSGTMEKLGSIWRCECGMMKKAMGKCGGAMEKHAGDAKPVCGTKIAAGKKQASAPLEFTKEAEDKMLELFKVCDRDIEKMAMALHAQGMNKEAIWGALSGIGRGVAAGAKALGKGQVARAGRAVAGGAKRTGGQLKRTFLEGGAQTAGQAGAMAGLKAVAQQNPALAVGAGAAGVAGMGYGAGRMMGKSGSDNRLLEVADAAGRLLAKTAETDMNVPIPIEEIRESIQEAQAREDIPGRAKRWQIGGGIGGGLAGGVAGFGAGRLLGGTKSGLVGAGLGAAGGAFGGSELGKGYGAEEARADKAVSMLRAMRAHQIGAMGGYGAGMRRGYSMGGSGGGSSEEEKLSSAQRIVDRLTG